MVKLIKKMGSHISCVKNANYGVKKNSGLKGVRNGVKNITVAI